MSFIKTTVIGGAVFLVPVIVLVFILGKAYDLMLLVAKPLNEFMPLDRLLGVAVIDLVTIILLVLICFLCGLLAKGKILRGTATAIDEKLMLLVPNYSYIKSLTGALENDKEDPMRVVMVQLDEMAQLGFLIEEIDELSSVVYFPSAPDPRSGSVVVIENTRLTKLDVRFLDAINSLRRFGLGSGNLGKKLS